MSLAKKVRKKALFELIYVSGVGSGIEYRVFEPGEVIICAGEKLDRCYFIDGGKVEIAEPVSERTVSGLPVVKGAAPASSETSYVVGARTFFTGLKSKHVVTAKTRIETCAVGSAYIIAQYNKGAHLQLFRPMLHDSDLSDVLMDQVKYRLEIDLRSSLSVHELEVIAEAQGAAFPEQNYDRLAGEILIELLRGRAKARGVDASMVSMPNFDTTTTNA